MMARPMAFQIKATTAAVGFLLGLAGMAFEQRWLVWTGAACLGIAFLLRFAGRKPDAVE